MWCKQCQQDVPAVVSPEGGTLTCPRCGQNVASLDQNWQPPLPESNPQPAAESSTGKQAAEETPTASGNSTASSDYDGWEFDEQLRHIRRILDKSSAQRRGSKTAYENEMARLDPPHSGSSPRWHLADKPKSRRTARKETRSGQRGPVLSLLTWVSLSLGTMVFVCGCILLGWSVIGNRPELWNVGLPVAAGGQIALLLGLVLQLDQLWHDSRQAASKLDHVDEQLHDLKTTATMLHTDHASPSSAFYAHLAGGAGPQLLLTDLKSQLDLLAMKLDRIDE